MSALQDIAIDLEAERVAEIEVETGQERSVASLIRIPRWFEAQPVGKKIATVLTVNLGFAFVAGLLIVTGFLQLSRSDAEVLAANQRSMTVQKLVTELGSAQMHGALMLATRDRSHAAEAEAALADAEARLAELATLPVEAHPEIHGALPVLRADISEFRRTLAAYNPRLAQGSRSSDQALALADSGEQMRQEGASLAAAMAKRAEAASASGSLELLWLATVWTLVAVLMVGFTLGARHYFNRSIGAVLAQMADQMTRFSRGEKDIAIIGRDRQDEIGGMARAMEIFHKAGLRFEKLMIERAKSATEERDKQARLEAEREEGRRQRDQFLAELATRFEGTVGDVVSGVAAAAAQLQTTSKSMTTTAQEASRRTNDVATAMKDANSGATAAAAASDEFAMSIGEISRQAASSAELARNATLSANGADQTISALADSAQQVGQIVELISTIAKRTNLLALNASIEAARGGEAGRGFAVVASEVKELAMQTSRATEQIAEQIRAMQDTTGASVDALRSISNQIAELESTAVSIASAVDQQSVAGQDLARSIDLAARGTEQVSSHIEEVRELSLSTGSAASQVHSSAFDLERQAASLRQHVDSFLAEVRRG